jgi:hypothetical protein
MLPHVGAAIPACRRRTTTGRLRAPRVDSALTPHQGVLTSPGTINAGRRSHRIALTGSIATGSGRCHAGSVVPRLQRCGERRPRRRASSNGSGGRGRPDPSPICTKDQKHNKKKKCGVRTINHFRIGSW